ncbi:MAG: hypothetical protein BWY82_01159 [Verrucomicrobia bacterium ADurb.Bin474]|nr:MAG: hypothetical protein BWY82_01159 [Verrucomicrobia bacterium ADurb.Bin474]
MKRYILILFSVVLVAAVVLSQIRFHSFDFDQVESIRAFGCMIPGKDGVSDYERFEMVYSDEAAVDKITGFIEEKLRFRYPFDCFLGWWYANTSHLDYVILEFQYKGGVSRQLVVRLQHYIRFGDYDYFRVRGMKHKVLDCLSQLEADKPGAEPSPE